MIGNLRGWAFIFSWIHTFFAKQTHGVNYFAYGSNMNTKILQMRRGINVRTNLGGGILHGHKLSFNVKGIPFVEPSFASVEPSVQHNVHGLVVDIDTFDLFKLYASEGVPLVYQPYKVNVAMYDTNINVTCITLRVVKGFSYKREHPPSRRYLDLIKTGARDINLNEEYRSYLDTIEPFNNRDFV